MPVANSMWTRIHMHQWRVRRVPLCLPVRVWRRKLWDRDQRMWPHALPEWGDLHGKQKQKQNLMMKTTPHIEVVSSFCDIPWPLISHIYLLNTLCFSWTSVAKATSWVWNYRSYAHDNIIFNMCAFSTDVAIYRTSSTHTCVHAWMATQGSTVRSTGTTALQIHVKMEALAL